MAVGRHLKKHWKKYALMTITWFASRWGAKKFREATITAAYCKEAKEYNDQKVSFTDGIDKVYVFLNPTANNKDAKRQFVKYSAPILHLSGSEVIIIETDYEGQAQTLINYIQSSTAAVLVAGGSGSLMEVVNGLMKRTDLDIPIGIIPLGKNNSFYKKMLGGAKDKNVYPARAIGEATINILRGKTKHVDTLKLQPDKGKTIYALDSINWGVVYSAEENKNSWRIFGRFRTFFSYLNTALRRWPMDFTMNITAYNSMSRLQQEGEKERNEKRKKEREEEKEGHSFVNHFTIQPVGFNITPNINEQLLTLSWLPYNNTQKWDYLKQGFMRSLYNNKAHHHNKDTTSFLSYNKLRTSRLSISPVLSNGEEEWFNVDGELFEALPISITLEHNRIKVFSDV